MKRIGYVQFTPTLGEIEANRDRIADLLEGLEADLLVLPELPFTGYALADRETARSLAEIPEDSPSVDGLAAACRSGGFSCVAGFAEREDDRVFNSAVLVTPAGLKAVYRKIHLFGFESELFDAGDDPPAVYEVDGLQVGLMVCFDWFFPETARLLALAGAEVIAHPSNLVLDWCQRSMVTRCLENNLFAVTANRCGVENRGSARVAFTGGSQITAPRGSVLASGPAEGDEVRIVEIDPGAARDKQITPANHLLGDRRPDLYGGLV